MAQGEGGLFILLAPLAGFFLKVAAFFQGDLAQVFLASSFVAPPVQHLLHLRIIVEMVRVFSLYVFKGEHDVCRLADESTPEFGLMSMPMQFVLLPWFVEQDVGLSRGTTQFVQLKFQKRFVRERVLT